MTMTTITDVTAAVRDLRPDAAATVPPTQITPEWVRDQMHTLGVTRYEDVTDDVLSAIVDRVDDAAAQIEDE